MYYVGKYAKEIGQLEHVFILDCGACDLEHMCLTTDLRGVLRFNVKVSVAKKPLHSGRASGIVPDSFRIGNELLRRLEDPKTGQMLLERLHVNISEEKYTQAQELVNELGGKIDWSFKFEEGVKPTTEKVLQQCLNRGWTP